MMYLNDCTYKDLAVTELFIVQSNYFARAKEVRDRFGQAVLPVDDSFPKIKGCQLFDLLSDKQIEALISTLGVGMDFGGGSGSLDMSHLRYGKVIIVCDETAAGTHIRTQVVAYFKKFSRPILDERRIFVPAFTVDESLSEDDFKLRVMDRSSRSLVEIMTGELLANQLEA
jgi:DNA gyrase subunit B